MAKNKAKGDEITKTSTSGGYTNIIESYLPAGTYQVSFNYEAGNTSQFVITDVNGNNILAITPYIFRGTGNYSATFTLDSAGYGYRCYAQGSLHLNYIMICPKELYDISTAYVPYRPSYQELYDRVVALENQ